VNIIPQRTAAAHLPAQAGAGASEAGRLCPFDYNYAPSEFARAAEFEAETLYVVGGLYGNLAALDTIKAMANAEHAEIVFNGDFHWFDAEPEWFAEIERGVRPHRALRGNVETEIAREGDIGAGCGCAYPPSVSGEIVRRSNDISAQLQQAMPQTARTRLAGLPMHAVAHVGILRVGIVHGDAAVLAGWRFAQDELDNPKRMDWLSAIYAAAQVDIFASTHTCLAALRDFGLKRGRLTVINNGAAGMPNFSQSHFGVITRIATTPSPHRPLYGVVRNGVHIDALAVNYDRQAFLTRFLKRWPLGSPAYQSYYSRIANGPEYPLAKAMP
jgi:hypothetical protein